MPELPGDTLSGLAALPRYYTYREVLACYPDEDAFLDAYCGDMPQEVRRHVEDSLDLQTLQTWLLRRLIRRLGPAPL